MLTCKILTLQFPTFDKFAAFLAKLVSFTRVRNLYSLLAIEVFFVVLRHVTFQVKPLRANFTSKFFFILVDGNVCL
jgi:hypothetical protein